MADPGTSLVTALYLEPRLLDQVYLHEKSNFIVEQILNEGYSLNYRPSVIKVTTNQWVGVKKSFGDQVPHRQDCVQRHRPYGADGFRLSAYLLNRDK